jgi:hypothetical protein
MLPTSIKPIFHRIPTGQSCTSALLLMRIRIQIFVSMRIHIRIRIQGASGSMQIWILVSHKKLNFFKKNIIKLCTVVGQKHTYDGTVQKLF